MFRFTIREICLLTLIVALAVGWWLDHAKLAPAAAERDVLDRRVQLLTSDLRDGGWEVKVTPNDVTLRKKDWAKR